MTPTACLPAWPVSRGKGLVMSAITRRGFVQSAAAGGDAFPLFTISGTKASGKVIREANTMLTRHYRAPFTVPENV